MKAAVKVHIDTDKRKLEQGKAFSLIEKIFFVICMVVFALILVGIIFCNKEYQLTAVSTFSLTVVAGQVFIASYAMFGKYEAFLRRYFYQILCGALLLLFVGNLVFGFILAYSPIFDLAAIYDGARYWVETGTFMAPENWAAQQDYYYYCTNNIGPMACLYVVFWIGHLFAIDNYYAMALVFTSLCTVCTVWGTVLIARRLFGVRQAMVALLMFAVNLPFWFMGATFYTDSLSIVYPVWMLYAYLRYVDSKKLSHQFGWLTLLGILCGVGSLIKITVAVMLIAIFIYHFLRNGWRQCWLFVLPILLALVCSCGVVLATEHTYMKQDKMDALHMPLTHWVMMSLRYDSGRYNNEDFTFTRSFQDPAERSAMVQQEMIRRMKERGVSGMLRLFVGKSIVVFGDATYGQSDFLDDNPLARGALHEYVLYDGARHGEYVAWCSGAFFAVLCFMFCGAIGFMFEPSCRMQCYIPQLSVFGIWLFLMCWECTARYTTNYVPMMILCAVLGVEQLARLLPRILCTEGMKK